MPKSPMRSAGMLTLRLLLGSIFFFQGFGKVFKWGMQNLYQMAFAPYEETWLPEFLLWITAYYTSFAELICGALLLMGLYRKSAYLILGSVLVVVAIGHGIKDPIWDLNHVVFRAALLIPLMLLPTQWDKWSLEARIRGTHK